MATQTKVVYYIGDENTPYLVKVNFYTTTNMLFYGHAFDLKCSIILSQDVLEDETSPELSLVRE